MRILWVNNVIIPKIAVDIGEKTLPVGGWMIKLADEISAVEGNELQIMFPHHTDVKGAVDGISYTGFVLKKEKDTGIIYKTISEWNPDVIHIFGTESAHSFEIARICQELEIIDKVVVSIQGVVSVIANHYTAYLPQRVVVGFTFRDLLKRNILMEQRWFRELGEKESKALRMVKHIIGRTDWDKAVTSQINPKAEYHFNNEMLRDSFYKNRWNINNCERYSIFCSQARQSYKGLHLALEALALLKTRFPQVHLYVAGRSYLGRPRYQRSYYEKYILKRIKELNIQENITFTGYLNEEQMCEQYLKAHVFISPSSIENSPNSVCEAMILGMPVVSSFVGGVVNLIEQGVNGYYYQADAPYMLAHYVGKVFEDDKNTVEIGMNAHRCAMERHEPEKIVEELNDIYRTVYKSAMKAL